MTRAPSSHLCFDAVVPRFDQRSRDLLREHLRAQARPPGALARLEEIAAQLAGIQARERPDVTKVVALLFAADHGMTRSGVSAYPASVTASMVRTLLAGRASANALALACGVDVHVIDAGVDADLTDPGLIGEKIARGTRDAVVEPAMTRAEATMALNEGYLVGKGRAGWGAQVVILGEMGIGNSSSAALLLHRLLPAPLADCIGPGAGHDEAGLVRKRAALSRAAARTSADQPFDVLCEFGGLEIAMMVGAAFGAASRRSAILVDGFISTAAVLVAIRMCPPIAQFCIFAHTSGEPGHRIALAMLKAEPILKLGLRLGEGTGAILAAPIVRAAALLADGVASLEEVLGAVP